MQLSACLNAAKVNICKGKSPSEIEVQMCDRKKCTFELEDCEHWMCLFVCPIALYIRRSNCDLKPVLDVFVCLFYSYEQTTIDLVFWGLFFVVKGLKFDLKSEFVACKCFEI
jgi:hypothetical protein